jgi:hypothetical protein
VTFILVSLLMAVANFVKRRETRTHILPALFAAAAAFSRRGRHQRAD